MRPLDPSSGRVLLAELLGLLPPPGRLKCLVMLACLEPDDPRLLLRLGALRPERTRRAILPREPRLENLAVLRIGVGQPGDALLACRAGHDLPLPVDLEAPLVEARAGASLPARVLGYRADDGHAVLALAVDQDLGVGVALVDQVLTREQIALLLRLMHLVDHVVVWCRRRRRLDVDDQMRPVLIAGRGEVHLVTHPFHLTLGAVPRLRVTRLWPR